MTPPGLIEGFSRQTLPGDGVTIDAMVGGSGPPVLLLHGYPQTRMSWREVAPRLAERYTVVVPDLRGYGRSEKPVGDVDHKRYSKRQMARDQIATMAALGFKSFRVAGHDRGGRVAYRLALDFPQAVEKLAVLDIVPTAKVLEASVGQAMGMFHWSFLAQPYPLPEELLAGKTDVLLRWLMERWASSGWQPHADVLDDYLKCLRDPASLHATCEDYRASWHVDRQLDLEDLENERKIEAPVLVLWGSRGALGKGQPLEAWRPWCRQLDGQALDCGHFLPEEAPTETAAKLLAFFS